MAGKRKYAYVYGSDGNTGSRDGNHRRPRPDLALRCIRLGWKVRQIESYTDLSRAKIISLANEIGYSVGYFGRFERNW